MSAEGLPRTHQHFRQRRVFPVPIPKFNCIFLLYKEKPPPRSKAGQALRRNGLLRGSGSERFCGPWWGERSGAALGGRADPRTPGLPSFGLLDRQADAHQDVRPGNAIPSWTSLQEQNSSPHLSPPGQFASFSPSLLGTSRQDPQVEAPARPGSPGNSDVMTPPPRIGCGSLRGRRRGGSIRTHCLPGNSDVMTAPPRIGCRSLRVRRRGGSIRRRRPERSRGLRGITSPS